MLGNKDDSLAYILLEGEIMEYHPGTLYASLFDHYVVRRTTQEDLDRKHNLTPQLGAITLALGSIVDEEIEAINQLEEPAKTEKLKELEDNGIKLLPLDARDVMTGIEHQLINLTIDGLPDDFQPNLVDPEYEQIAEKYFGGLKSYLEYVWKCKDFTILSHEIFVRAYDSTLKMVHGRFEDSPINTSRYFLGPVLTSEHDALTANNLVMWLIAQLVVRPGDIDGFMSGYREAFAVYHGEWATNRLRELGVRDYDDLVVFLSDGVKSYQRGTYRYRPICQLTPALATPALQHVVDCFGAGLARVVADQYYK